MPRPAPNAETALMNLLRLTALAALLVAPARATSVVAPTFSELVAEADSIVRGTVTAVACRVVSTPRGDAIHTYVTLAVEQCVKGSAAGSITLTFLGGTVGTRKLTISGMPQFTVGDREILFVQGNGRQLCPMVGLYHGRYRVLRDPVTRRDYVARDNRTPLASTGEVSLPLLSPTRFAAAARDASTALDPAEFLVRIRHEAAARNATAP